MRSSYNQQMKRTVFNNIHEATFSPERNYYGVVEIDGTNYLLEHKSKFRNEAVSYFEEAARLERGRLTTVGAFK
ncbi:hypothetical protein EVU96_08625 [Bacillus infantis]|uniref:hypothetical protein n=1 Tax=Bacillus infantis TaxID=324767 RepID=UPI00101E1DC9|nr:hypothetical protein [Bacillus infantis]RYI30467.1 hypothetical protein EVU96_08625 [Bacillus infantis]